MDYIENALSKYYSELTAEGEMLQFVIEDYEKYINYLADKKETY